MPELPEVETSLRYLNHFLKNSKILNIEFFVKKLRWEINPKMHKLFNDSKIIDLERLGKYILIHSSNTNSLIIHLGMSGYLKIENFDFTKIKHDHVVLTFRSINNQIKKLVLNDQRKFGFIDFRKTYHLKKHFLIKNLGIDALSEHLNVDFLKNKFIGKQKNIKNALLDQKLICGIGNIYASEILFLAKIHPLKEVGYLNEKEIELLIENIIAVLNNAIVNGGTSIKNFKKPDGKLGYFKQKLKVYGRDNQSCYNCSNKILQIKINKRATYLCVNCQKN